MAGKNIVLQPTQIVFREGDESNGMFLVRSGELEVYLEKDGKTISLAAVQAGGMIGEMALFDQQPRSASVRAKVKSEVTHISNDDFAKLMKQIPKWFTSLMGTLSTRLRVTNERLKTVEAQLGGGQNEALSSHHDTDDSTEKTADTTTQSQGSTYDLRMTLQMLYVFDLIIHKDSVKEGKHWQLERPTLSKNIEMLYADELKRFNEILEVLQEHNFLQMTTNNYKVDIIDIANRGVITRLIEYMADFQSKGGQALSPDGVLLLKCLLSYGKKCGYETFTATLQELALEARGMGIEEVPDWKSQLPIFKVIHDELKLAKTSDGALGIKSTPKAVEELLNYHTVISKTLS